MISLEQSFILNSFSDTEYLPLSFTWIAPDEITLGHQRFQNEDDESSMGWSAPPFPTRITKGYWIAKYPITNAHWSIITKEKILENPDYPRIQVSWIVAMQFCKQLNLLTVVGVLAKRLQQPNVRYNKLIFTLPNFIPIFSREKILESFLNFEILYILEKKQKEQNMNYL